METNEGHFGTIDALGIEKSKPVEYSKDTKRGTEEEKKYLEMINAKPTIQ